MLISMNSIACAQPSSVAEHLVLRFCAGVSSRSAANSSSVC